MSYRLFYKLILITLSLSLVACSGVPAQHKKSQSNYLTNYQSGTYLEKKFAPLLKQHPNKTGFFLLANGVDAFAVRSALIKKAQSKIDVQYYMIHEDKSGSDFYRLLKQAANRGVKIRLLIDDIHLSNETTLLKDLAAHPNVEVRVFNPFNRHISRYPQFVFKLGKITRRMHDKSLTIDNQISIVGGRNIADEYFHQQKEVRFGDMDVAFIGPRVRDVSLSFDRFWNSRLVDRLDNLEKIPASSKALTVSYKSALSIDDSYYLNALDKQKFPFSWGKAKLIADDPEKIKRKRNTKKFIKVSEISKYISNTKKELLIFTPYLVPTKAGLRYVKELRKKGVRIILLTNSLHTTDVPFVHSGYMNYRKALIKLGVELHELKVGDFPLFKSHAMGERVRAKKNSLHAKVMVFDRKLFYIGSMNIDPRSVYENTELGLVIESPKVANLIYKWFARNADDLTYTMKIKNLSGRGETLVWQDGESKFYIKEPKTRLLGRIWMDFLSGLPIAENHL